MELTKSILKDIRAAVGLDIENDEFDVDLLMHINNAIGKLNQNGVGNFLVVQNVNQVWNELQDPAQTEGNKYFHMIPLFITLSTKLLFDPPPPSSAEYHASNIDQILWRLKIAYEEPYVAPVVSDDI